MPKIRVLLKPEWDGDKIPSLSVRIETDIPARAGEMLFQINKVTIFKPFTELLEPFALRDAEGVLPMEAQEGKEPPVTYEKYIASRDSQGLLTLTYALKLDGAGKNPVFDLGYEKGGMNGSGMTFMPAFAQDGEIDYELKWDLSALPPRAIGVWSLGEGSVSAKGDKGLLMQTFYAAGVMDSVRLGNFSYYWFPNPKIVDSALTTSKIFDYESRFFGDKGEPYTIFARHTADENSSRAGGTALTRSYMYLYLNDDQLDYTWLKFLFAHEMVHNWVHLADDPFGTCTWYVEGMAEYYSTVLPLRMGAVSREELAGELNKRAKSYYENPSIHATNAECGAGLMVDREKTRIPYGRGFFYLTYADAAIRKVTQGEKCLDDVMRALNRRFEEDHTIKNEAWFEEYGRYVGEDTARREYEFLRDGGVVTPDVTCFEGAVSMHKIQGSVRGSGESCDLWQFEAKG